MSLGIIRLGIFKINHFICIMTLLEGTQIALFGGINAGEEAGIDHTCFNQLRDHVAIDSRKESQGKDVDLLARLDLTRDGPIEMMAHLSSCLSPAAGRAGLCVADSDEPRAGPCVADQPDALDGIDGEQIQMKAADELARKEFTRDGSFVLLGYTPQRPSSVAARAGLHVGDSDDLDGLANETCTLGCHLLGHPISSAKETGGCDTSLGSQRGT
ncbi:zinc finger protein [Sesbania bispinosa]|nr:zinc finger protein [Sesbania bispinosa]